MVGTVCWSSWVEGVRGATCKEKRRRMEYGGESRMVTFTESSRTSFKMRECVPLTPANPIQPGV